MSLSRTLSIRLFLLLAMLLIGAGNDASAQAGPDTLSGVLPTDANNADTGYVFNDVHHIFWQHAGSLVH